MTDMLWIVPSRSRPDNIANLIASWQPTRVMAEMLVVVDEDDPTVEDYRRVELNFAGFNWVRFEYNEHHLMLGPKLNKAAREHCANYHQIGFMGDDHRPRTMMWDGLMAKQLRNMGTGLVYGNDLFQGKKLPTAVAMTSDIISRIGYMVPPTIKHLYVDNFWLELGQGAECIEYMENVVIEHMHPHAGKAVTDPQYADVNSSHRHEQDGNAFETYKRKGLSGDIAKVKELTK